MLLRDYLQQQHGISRRKITALIDQKEISLNDSIIESYKAECELGDTLIIKPLAINEKIFEIQDSIYPKLLIFNKPIGYTCSKFDAHNQTIYEILPKSFEKNYYYIGRLDKASRGLMLLTTDPKLVHEFEHPSKEIEKSYIVELDKDFNRRLKGKILEGINDEGEFLRTKRLEKGTDGKLLITLNEGKKRHIRRIFKALGYRVVDLKRISIGKYHLGDLKEGSYQKVEL